MLSFAIPLSLYIYLSLSNTLCLSLPPFLSLFSVLLVSLSALCLRHQRPSCSKIKLLIRPVGSAGGREDAGTASPSLETATDLLLIGNEACSDYLMRKRFPPLNKRPKRLPIASTLFFSPASSSSSTCGTSAAKNADK